MGVVGVLCLPGLWHYSRACGRDPFFSFGSFVAVNTASLLRCCVQVVCIHRAPSLQASYSVARRQKPVTHVRLHARGWGHRIREAPIDAEQR